MSAVDTAGVVMVVVGTVMVSTGIAGNAAVAVLVWRRKRPRSALGEWYRWDTAAVTGTWLGAVGFALDQQWGHAVFWALCAALASWHWRRPLRRGLRAWGERALARLRVMVRTMRQVAKPRPVLRPHRIPA